MRRLSRVLMALTAITLLALAMCSCGTSSPSLPAQLIGDWNCQETASDGVTDTSFYHLTITEDGYFSIFDQAAGNPGIMGDIKSVEVAEENNRYIAGSLTIDFNTEDFDPPFCWNMEEKDTLEFKVSSEGHVQLSHNDIILDFDPDIVPDMDLE
ncbi:MAG: hypothetical protein KBS66_00200 [Eubacterium sp.]|nr:hypothetical protein [Candidatus Colimonas fimequi]